MLARAAARPGERWRPQRAARPLSRLCDWRSTRARARLGRTGTGQATSQALWLNLSPTLADSERAPLLALLKTIPGWQERVATALTSEEYTALLESGKALLADDPRRLARIEVVSEAFRLTELFAQYHATRTRLVANGLDVLSERNEGGPTALPKQLSDFIAARAAFDTFSQQLLEDPIHARLKSFTKYSKLDPVAFALAAMAQAGVEIPVDDYLEYAAVAEVAQRWGADAGAFHSKLSNVDLQHEATAPQARNFLGPDLPKVSGWHFDFRPAEHLAVGTVSAGQGIRVTGADVFSIFRDIPVISGQRYLLDASMAYQISPDNRSQVRLSWTDQNGDALRRETLFRCPTGSSDGVRRVVLPIRAPEQAYTMRLRFFISRQYEGDFLNLQRMDFGLIAN